MAYGESLIGRPTRRVDGALKVTGAAKYAGEYGAADLLHGAVVSSAVAKGRITAIDVAAAKAIPGVVEIYTHENRPGTAWFDSSYQDQVAPPGSPFRPLRDEHVTYSGQPVALVVAETFEAARDAAALVKVDYAPEEHITDLDAVKGQSYVPPKKRSGIQPPPSPRGDADRAFDEAPVRIEQDYRCVVEHHNPMEPFATTVVWEGGGKLTLYDKTQGSQNVQDYITKVFGLNKDDVRVINSFVGGAFGSALRPQYHAFLAVMAATVLERSVRVVLTRDQMFTSSYRPETLQTVSLGCDEQGKLTAIKHHAIAGTSQFEDYQENVVNWSGMLYACDNAKLTYKLAKIDTYTPSDMRAPGATIGVYALECAMDELSYEAGIDPLELRIRNYSKRDQNEDKPYTSKALMACYAEGAERFGWGRRQAAPRSMRDGRELIGWGLATGVWEAQISKTAARAELTADGRLEVASATSDIGTGTYTVMAQTGADALGLPIDHVTAKLGDSSLPAAPVEGGSWGAASTCSAIEAACELMRKKLFKAAQKMTGTPLADIGLDEAVFAGGRIDPKDRPGSGPLLTEVMRAAGLDSIAEESGVSPNPLTQMRYAAYTHSAIFAEVRVDEELGVIRVTRIVNAVAGGRILNPKTARSQIMGGVVMGLGQALYEETMMDHVLGRFMNHNLAEYHVSAHADIEEIDVLFVEEEDDKVSPIGAKGLGEIGIVGTSAAIANAIYHATGKRIRDLPITIDKLLR